MRGTNAPLIVHSFRLLSSQDWQTDNTIRQKITHWWLLITVLICCCFFPPRCLFTHLILQFFDLTALYSYADLLVSSQLNFTVAFVPVLISNLGCSCFHFLHAKLTFSFEPIWEVGSLSFTQKLCRSMCCLCVSSSHWYNSSTTHMYLL